MVRLKAHPALEDLPHTGHVAKHLLHVDVLVPAEGMSGRKVRDGNPCRWTRGGGTCSSHTCHVAKHLLHLNAHVPAEGILERWSVREKKRADGHVRVPDSLPPGHINKRLSYVSALMTK